MLFCGGIKMVSCISKEFIVYEAEKEDAKGYEFLPLLEYHWLGSSFLENSWHFYKDGYLLCKLSKCGN